MSFAEIEAELGKLRPDELRRLALKSWRAFVEKEGHSEGAPECEEDDPVLLTALDEAVARADAAPQQGYTADEVRQRIGRWTSR